jgi:hypothetical protein
MLLGYLTFSFGGDLVFSGDLNRFVLAGRVSKMRRDRGQTAHLQTALLHRVGAGPDTNRSVGLHSLSGFGLDRRPLG